MAHRPWSLTNSQKSKIKVCQRAMERSILGVKLTDRVRNTILRSKTGIADVAEKAAKLKWDWAGHVCRMPDKLWAQIAQNWCPETVSRGRGRPRRRWRDELDRFLKNWKDEARKREVWKKWREAFAQEWLSYLKGSSITRFIHIFNTVLFQSNTVSLDKNQPLLT